MRFLTFVLLAFVTGADGGGPTAQRANIAEFARPCCAREPYHLQTTFDYAHPASVVQDEQGRWIYGLQWAEEREIFEVAVRFRQPYDAKLATFQYWNLYWPQDPPHMPTIEDPLDDPWQGQWLNARAAATCTGSSCRFTFEPLTADENQRATNLPGLTYRRALRFRLLFPAGQSPEIDSVEVFSQSTVKPVQFRITFDLDAGRQATFHPYNGWLRGVRPVKDGAEVTVDAIDPQPAGSHDVTVIQVRHGEDRFSFTPSDLDKGPIYVPDYHAYITLASDTRPFAKSMLNASAGIRQRLAREPEQTYERATSEIPALDPVERQGDRLYLPLAADSSWQKFAFEWGGNVTISKNGTKAFGRERERLSWTGDRIRWRIGTGATPSFRERSQDSTLATLEDHLPVAIARWKTGNVEYEEEAFATLLSGPLSPDDPGRSEQTPAVLLIKVRARNSSPTAEAAHLWLGTALGETLRLENGMVTTGQVGSVRYLVRTGISATSKVEENSLHISQPLGPGKESITHLALPFIPGLTAAEREQLRALKYETERDRVIAYWRQVIAHGVPFSVPEARFNTFARGLLARIRISTTKDPKTGVYMVPAASYFYRVFANESVFQAQLLDVLGHHGVAGKYYQAQIAMQGSKPFPGSFTGDQKPVYHGARVDKEYDYTASGYNLDHGTVLWSLGEHYFVTRDREWLRNAASSMKSAANWIIEQRKLTQAIIGGEPCPEYGLLPAGRLEDNQDWGHWLSVNAYASVGLSSLARILEESGDGDAPRLRREADAYRADLRSAVVRAAAAAPVIRLRDNTYVPYVPTRVHQRIRLFGPIRVAYYSRYPQKVLPTYRLSATRELLYGPLILIDTGVFDARERLAEWVLDDWEDNATMSEPLGLHVHGWVDEKYWFSRGGMVFQANLQNPIRTYIRRGEGRAAVRNLYNDFVSCYYPAVNVFTEEYRQWRSPSGPFYKIPDEAKFVHRLRDALITEYGDDLILGAAAPARWFAPGERISVTNAPTHYGPASYQAEATASEIRATVDLPTRNPFRDAWLTLRGQKLSNVTVNGKPWTDVDHTLERIRLPKTSGTIQVVVRREAPGAR